MNHVPGRLRETELRERNVGHRVLHGMRIERRSDQQIALAAASRRWEELRRHIVEGSLAPGPLSWAGRRRFPIEQHSRVLACVEGEIIVPLQCAILAPDLI